MKRILITGANSYIGTNVEHWLLREPEKYQVDTIDMIDGSWREKDFSGYDVVFHVAGIVHRKVKDEQNYFKINRDLAVEVAMKSKNEKISHFIFLSTMGVYGLEVGIIDENTTPSPKTSYAQSKFEAEVLLQQLEDDSFCISIIRPPMVYGKGCKGNYSRLSNFSRKIPVIPDFMNSRSMIYIENFAEFIKLIINHRPQGIFFPQNREYVNTSEMMYLIANMYRVKVIQTKLFNFIIGFSLLISVMMRKVFGSCIYSQSLLGSPETELNNFCFSYNTCSFRESIIKTEG